METAHSRQTLDICYYGELDPFGGSYPHEAAYLPRLIQELSFALLFFDGVHLPPGNFLEHALTLPALEALRPFVESGWLGTSTDPRRFSNVGDFLSDRIQTALAAEPLKRRGPLSAWRTGQLEELDLRQRELLLFDAEKRLRDLLPERWPIVRDTPSQISSFSAAVTTSLEQAREQGSTGASKLLEIVNQVLDSGIRPDRSTILAKLTSRRGHLSPRELAQMVTLVQLAFLKEGGTHRWSAGLTGTTSGQLRVGIYPGGYARRFRRLRDLLPIGIPEPSFAWNVDQKIIAGRLRRCGYVLAALLKLPVRRLFELAQSNEWQAARQLLKAPEELFDIALTRPVLRPVLQEVLRRSPPRTISVGALPEVLVPAPWQLSIEAHLGTHNVVIDEEQQSVPLVLDWEIQSVIDQQTGERVPLDNLEAWVLTLLITRGEVGVTWSEMRLLLVERVARRQGALCHPGWPVSSMPSSAARITSSAHEVSEDSAKAEQQVFNLRNQIDQAKRRLEKKLAPWGITIETQRRWRLIGSERIRLHRTPWDILADGPAEHAAPPSFLAPQEAALFSVLAKNRPQPVDLATLVTVVNPCHASDGDKYVQKLLSKLKQRLKAEGTPFLIESYHGVRYRLSSTKRR